MYREYLCLTTMPGSWFREICLVILSFLAFFFGGCGMVRFGGVFWLTYVWMEQFGESGGNAELAMMVMVIAWGMLARGRDNTHKNVVAYSVWLLFVYPATKVETNEWGEGVIEERMRWRQQVRSERRRCLRWRCCICCFFTEVDTSEIYSSSMSSRTLFFYRSTFGALLSSSSFVVYAVFLQKYVRDRPYSSLMSLRTLFFFKVRQRSAILSSALFWFSL